MQSSVTYRYNSVPHTVTASTIKQLNSILYIYTYKHTYIHKYVHTYIHTYIPTLNMSPIFSLTAENCLQYLTLPATFTESYCSPALVTCNLRCTFYIMQYNAEAI
jgi:hypothetical protein